MKTLGENKVRLEEANGFSRLGKFGSVAKNGATVGSDVDLVPHKIKPDIYQLSNLLIELPEILGPGVELVHMHRFLGSLFKEYPQRDAIYA